ncbi:Uma2 family endonuclease [Nocardiopsis ganjiahuensis]|uniref:Uma2 family endonuclease n=1 Tax=Nocardiopsis ganjiahuensis TaxID=239984 RepID=UPI00047548D2|nr:Uma2 family endonuclease [Nocardiopsis ganjiahuensis]
MSIRHPEAPERRLTVDDLQDTPDDGRRYELADGRLDVSPAPKPLHTRVAYRLGFHLGRHASDELEIGEGPGIILSGDSGKHRIPDLAVFAQEPPEEGYYTAPPLLAVEIVSPESVFRDNHTKRHEYAAFGIPSYWIINPNPDKPGIMEFRLVDGVYQEVGQTQGEELFETEVPFPVKFVPHWLVASGPWRENLGGPAGD